MKSRDFYTKVLASTLVFLFLILFLSTASASATAQNASTTMIYAYITNEGSDNVSVIDTTNNTVIATVSVGGRYPDAVAVTPDGTKVYVASYDDVMSSVSVIDTATNNVRHTVDGLFNVGQIAFSPDGKKAYVTNYDSVSVIDTTTDSVTATVPVGNSPYGIAVNPNGTKAYVTHVWSDTVSVIDTATNTVIATVPVGHIPIGVSVTPDGKKVYVANHDSSIVSVIDTDINTVIATVPVGSYPNLVAISPDGTKVYVTNWISNDVSIIDTATDNVIATVNVGKGPQGLSVTPDGTKVYVANYDSNDISVIDTATNTVIDRVPVGINPVARGNFIGLVPIQEGTNLCLSSQAPANKDHGSSMTYTLHYNNFGDASAHNVVLEDILDNNVAFVSASDGGVYDSNTGTIRWDIGSVNSSDNGYRTMNVSIPQDVPVRAVIVNNANISTSDLDVRYYDNEAQARTSVTGLTLPANIKVEPNNGGIGTPSVYWGNPVTFSYHNTGLPVTGVNITIHFDDGLPDITGTMANVTNSTSDWTYTTTLYPRHGKATVIYTKQLDPEPYTPSYDVRGDYGDFITADDIYNYIKDKYPQSPMLSEPDIGSRFINSATTYGIDPVFLVSLAEVDSQFGTVGWAAEHPEAHNAFGYGVVYDNNTTQLYGASSWGDMVDQVAWSIAKGPNFFSKGCYTVEDIISVIYTDHSAQYSNQVYSEANPNQVHLAAIPIAPIAYVVLGFLLNHYADQFYDDICAWVKYHMNDVNTYVITQQALNGLLPPLFLPISFDIYVDPAGYIYDVDTGQRISGAYVWLQRPDGSGDWQNVSTGENPPVSQPDTNPLISDKDGMYQWDTLPGSYRVHVESPGYEPADSIVVSVPPPVFDLHVGLHHIYDPDVPPIIPVANFSNDISSGYAPLKVYFTDLSENATGISWDFGDGNNSTDRYPIHTYSAPGNYTVNLTASNGNGVNSKTGTIDAQALPIYPVADFITNVSEGYAPLTVQFNDSSVNVDSWNWDFNNDGNVDSTEQNPIYTFKSVGNYTVNLTVSNQNGTDSKLATIVVTSLVIPPQSVSSIQSSPASTWINWTWTNPDDPNFDHTEIYLNNTFQANTSAEYFNTTDLQPETDYTIGMRTADIYGNVNETWVNASTKTKSLPDIDQTITDVDLPVIESVMVFPANTTAGSKIDVSANITDNIGVSEVTAGNVQLMNIDGSWQGNITAPSSFGKYSLSIKASDAAGNTVNTSVPYNVVRRQGKVNIEILPTASKIVTGKNATLAIKIKNTQNIDDTFKVRVNVNGLPASYRAGIPWFNWTEKTVNLRAKQEVLIPIELKVPAGTVTGVKVFRANVNSEKFSVRGSDNGYLVISRPSKDINKQIGPRGLWFSR